MTVDAYPLMVASDGSDLFIGDCAAFVEGGLSMRDEQTGLAPEINAQSAQDRKPRALTEDGSEPLGEAPISATGLLPKTRLMSAGGRDSRPIAFLNTPGMELLYSFVGSGAACLAFRRFFALSRGGVVSQLVDLDLQSLEHRTVVPQLNDFGSVNPGFVTVE